MKVISKEHTALAYGEGETVVTLQPGENSVTAEQFAVLEADKNWCQHRDAGYMQIVHETEAAAEEVPPAPVVVDPRAKLPGETKKAYDARMKALDDAEAEATATAARKDKFLADLNGLTAEEKAAMIPTLSDEEKAWAEGAQ